MVNQEDVIVPPPQIQKIINKTALFVSKQGILVEAQLLQRNTAKLNFLKHDDHYHPYYQQKLREYSGGKVGAKPDEEQKEKVAEIKLQEPPPAKFLVSSLPLYALDLDVIKLTAQFVARNGRDFQAGLLNREHRNPQFDFLKPTNSLHLFFNNLVRAYTNCLLPDKKLEAELNDLNKLNLLDSLLGRVEWQKKKKKEEEEEAENSQQKGRAQHAMIDWHDFVVVETITFDTEPEKAAPTAAAGKPAPTANPPPSQSAVDMDTEMDIEMETDESEPIPSLDTNIKIRKNLASRNRAVDRSLQYQVCPNCNQEIPVADMQEHVRICLLDPQYIQQREALRGRLANPALAPDDDIVRNLTRLAAKRKDIFGVDETEGIGAGAKTDPKEILRRDAVTWDGHTGSAQRTAAAAQPTQAEIAARMEQQRAQELANQRAQVGPTTSAPPLQPPPPAAPPGMAHPPVPVPFNPRMHPSMMGTPAATMMHPSMVPPPMAAPPVPAPPSQPPPPSGEPPAKRQRLGNKDLLPESEFLAEHAGPVTITVQIPKLSKNPSWKLEGQTIDVVCAVGDSIGQLKSQIKDQIGMPANKQKLKAEGLPFFKDSCTLAYYNLTSDVIVQLGVKERGGRR